MKTKTAIESIVFYLACVGGLILVNALSCQLTSKVDLTERGLYSLTESSKRTVSALPEKLIIKAYFGHVPQAVKRQQQYVENLLDEYARAGNGKVSWEKIDPFDDPEKEKELGAQGIKKRPFVVEKEGSREQVLTYFVVEFLYLDKKEQWAPPQRFSVTGIEAQFTTRIHRMVHGRKKVGITTGFGEPEQARALAHPNIGLGGIYQVVPLDWKKAPEQIATVDVLIVNGPSQPVDEKAQYYLDQHIMAGKPVAFLMRGLRWQSGGGQQQNPMMAQLAQQESPYLGMPANHGLAGLLAKYGFEINADTVIDGKNSVNGFIPMGKEKEPLMSRIFFPLTRSLANGEHDVLSGVPAVVMPFSSTVKLVGPLKDGKSEGGEVRPLFETSPTSFVKEGVLAVTRTTSLDAKNAKKGPFIVAYAVSGKFSSFFKTKPASVGAPVPTLTPGKDAAAMSVPTADAIVLESPVTTRMIVIANSEFVEDKIYEFARYLRIQAYVNGYRAMHTMVDWLLADEGLASVMNKQIARPLTHLEPAEAAMVKWGNTLGTPFFLVLFGLLYWRVRETRAKNVKL